MKSREPILHIINAILWATALIASSIMLAGTEYEEKVVHILLALWFASSLLLQIRRDTMKSEWDCIRDLFRASSKGD